MSNTLFPLLKNISNASEFYIQNNTVQSERIQQSTFNDSARDNSSDEASFSKLLSETIDTLNKTQKEADRAIADAVAGRTKNLHETMLIMEKADLTYKLAMQVRNKIIDAYREVMKMQI